jgi:hypothetical protein
MLNLILGDAAVRRCGKRPIFSANGRAHPFSRTLRKEPALSEAEGVGDGDHRCTL